MIWLDASKKVTYSQLKDAEKCLKLCCDDCSLRKVNETYGTCNSALAKTALYYFRKAKKGKRIMFMR